VKKLRVLSLCDGGSGAYLAFKELGIDIEYHAVEIDKHARAIADSNIPNIIRWENDVTKITKSDIEFHGPFDWITFGSPCQSLSVAGNGKGLLGKSGILFNCIDVLNWCREINPEIKFLIENVKMKQEFLDQFDMVVGDCNRILINSSLVSAQKRERYYWTNFKVEQPEDTEEFVYQILEEDFNSDLKFSPKDIFRITESRICWSPTKIGKESIQNRAYSVYGKSPSLVSGNPKNKCNIFQFSPEKHGEMTLKEYLKSSNISEMAIAYSSSTRENKRIEQRANLNGKANTLTTGDGCCGGLKSANMVASSLDSEIIFRRLTVRECARLQKFPEWYKFSASSKTQSYKLIGNGWCISVISHILKYGLGLLKAEELGEDLL